MDTLDTPGEGARRLWQLVREEGVERAAAERRAEREFGIAPGALANREERT